MAIPTDKQYKILRANGYTDNHIEYITSGMTDEQLWNFVGQLIKRWDEHMKRMKLLNDCNGDAKEYEKRRKEKTKQNS